MEARRSSGPGPGAPGDPGGNSCRGARFLAGAVLVVLAPLILGAGQAGGGSDESPPSSESASFLLVRGHLVSLSTTACVIRDANGESMSFIVDEHTTVIGIVHEGDWVEVYASPEKRVRSIFKPV